MGAVYQRGGKIVEPRNIPIPGGKRSRLGECWQISECRPSRIRALASESCFFQRLSKKGKRLDAAVPDWLAGLVLTTPAWPFPSLAGIAEAPTMRPDGSIITERGYDAETGIYLAGDLRLDIPETPTLGDAVTARNLLLDVICDFPFAGDPDDELENVEVGKSVWLSGLLSTAARPVIGGPVPMHIIEASMRGSGKSKLVDAASIINTGRSASRMIYVDSNEEMDKRISSLALAGDSSVLIDNIIGEFGCPSLDAALTSTLYRGRVLGNLEMTPHMPMNIVWWGTGNGMTIGADLARRSLLARLEPPCEHPEEREGPRPGTSWRHPRLLSYVMENRAMLLGAALTLVRAYILAGSPKQLLKPMDFEEWSSTIRSAIVWVGLPDPGETVRDVRAADTRADAFSTFVERWPALENKPVTVRELLDFASEITITPTVDMSLEKRKLWRDALLEWCPPNRAEGGDLPSARILGCALRKIKGAIVGDHKLEHGKKGEQGMPWTKIRVTSPFAARSLFDQLP
jgi:putative DNA primase/helicase